MLQFVKSHKISRTFWLLSSCDICTFDKAFSCTTILCFNTPLFIFSSFTHQWISLNLNIIFSFAISLGQYGNKTIALTFLCNKLHFNRQRYFAQNIICLSKAIMGNFSFILSIENWFRLVRNTFFHTTIFLQNVLYFEIVIETWYLVYGIYCKNTVYDYYHEW